MVRKSLFLLIILTILNCEAFKNSTFGKPRVKKNKFSLDNNIVYNSVDVKIDTNALYKLIFEEHENFSSKSPFTCQFYKFYSNRKVGLFDCKDFNIDSLVLDPRYARMGYYSYNGKYFISEIFMNSWHGSYIKRDTIQFNKDKMIIINKYGKGAIKKSVFKKIEMPKYTKKLNPDW